MVLASRISYRLTFCLDLSWSACGSCFYDLNCRRVEGKQPRMATPLSTFSLGLRVDKMVAEIRAIVGFIWLNRPAKEHDRIILLHFEDNSHTAIVK